ncbi:unnamed protein product [Cuscuta campestris]|uniref:Integrase catalytic domain-containing protein n=1 Tax=Cuscuta campestris TaxID=132261 RepID=A0A484KBB8_9ASTE|nr:unnamed protein product [Cuscuta campestris]
MIGSTGSQKETIDDWDTLAEKFLTHFAANKRQRLPYSHLLNICIRKGEVHGADDQALVAMFQAALPRGEVRKELRKNPPPTYQETLARAKFLASEEFDDAPDYEATSAKRAPADSGEIAKKRRKKKDYTAGPRTPSAGVYSVGTLVGTDRELAPSPLPQIEAYAVSSSVKYCEYHRNNTHNTKECFTLQKKMHRLIARGPAPRDDGAAFSQAIDYFTKWVEVAPLASIIGAQCQKFLAKQVICCFGVPEHIITDNGTQFESKTFNDFLESWGIKHSYASVGYPQTNGQVENANRTIVDGLKLNLEACGGESAEELPYILWTYRTTPRRETRETPFALCYKFEAREPTEISIATPSAMRKSWQASSTSCMKDEKRPSYGQRIIEGK